MITLNNQSISVLNLDNRHRASLQAFCDYLMTSVLFSWVDKVILYGSVARKEAKYDSDVDILLTLLVEDSKEVHRAIQALNSAMGELRAKDGSFLPELDIHCYTKESYETKRDVYFENIRKEGIVLYERN